MRVWIVYDDTVEPADFDSIEVWTRETMAERRVLELKEGAKQFGLRENYKISERELN